VIDARLAPYQILSQEFSAWTGQSAIALHPKNHHSTKGRTTKIPITVKMIARPRLARASSSSEDPLSIGISRRSQFNPPVPF
jgi:hypothetical protein